MLTKNCPDYRLLLGKFSLLLMVMCVCVCVFKTSVEKFMQQCAPILRKNDYSIILYNKVSSERSQFFFFCWMMFLVVKGNYWKVVFIFFLMKWAFKWTINQHWSKEAMEVTVTRTLFIFAFYIGVDQQCRVSFKYIVKWLTYTYFYTYFFKFFSHSRCCKILSRAPCAIQ